MPPTSGTVDEDFEFLLNLLVSDGVEPDPPPRATDSRENDGDEGDRTEGFEIQSGTDGKLDLGRVKAFYEKKKTTSGKEARDRYPRLLLVGY